MSVLYSTLDAREQYNYISKTKGVRQISLLKRETGVNPVRTRHRILRAKADNHWETGKGPERRINKSGELPFVVREQYVPCHEELAVHMNRMRNREVVFSESVHLVVDTLCFNFMRYIRKEEDFYEKKNGSGTFCSNGSVITDWMRRQHNKDYRG